MSDTTPATIERKLTKRTEPFTTLRHRLNAAKNEILNERTIRQCFRKMFDLAMDDSDRTNQRLALQYLIDKQLGKNATQVEVNINENLTIEERIEIARRVVGFGNADDHGRHHAIGEGDRSGVPALPAPLDQRPVEVRAVRQGGAGGPDVRPQLEVAEETHLPRPHEAAD